METIAFSWSKVEKVKCRRRSLIPSNADASTKRSQLLVKRTETYSSRKIQAHNKTIGTAPVSNIARNDVGASIRVLYQERNQVEQLLIGSCSISCTATDCTLLNFILPCLWLVI